MSHCLLFFGNLRSRYPERSDRLQGRQVHKRIMRQGIRYIVLCCKMDLGDASPQSRDIGILINVPNKEKTRRDI